MTTARFADHAQERMAEREISYEQVQRVLDIGEITRGTETGQLKYTHGNIRVLVDLKKSLIVNKTQFFTFVTGIDVGTTFLMGAIHF